MKTKRRHGKKTAVSGGGVGFWFLKKSGEGETKHLNPFKPRLEVNLERISICTKPYTIQIPPYNPKP